MKYLIAVKFEQKTKERQTEKRKELKQISKQALGCIQPVSKQALCVVLPITPMHCLHN